MIIRINDKLYDVPFDICLMPLKKYIEFKKLYGQSVYTKNDPLEALDWYSFWTGFDIQSFPDIAIKKAISDQYQLFYPRIRESIKDASDYTLKERWLGATWAVQSPISVEAFELTLGRVPIIDTVLDLLHTYQQGKYENLKLLSAIFYRKEGEAFNETLIQSDSVRMKLMDELPLSNAYQVLSFLHARFGFLLATNKDIFLKESLYFN